jgi:F0F1-type ATP synthase assembly protein I
MIKNLLSADDPEPQAEPKPAPKRRRDGLLINLFDSETLDDESDPEPYKAFEPPAEPESMAQTVRQSGLAWSAGIAFFGAVVFMMILGWGADLLLGSSPWGIVGGIIIGSVIGFFQFFRITSQIFKK